MEQTRDEALADALIKAGVTIPEKLEEAKAKFSGMATISKESIAGVIAEWAKSDEAKHYITAPINSGGGAMGSGRGRHEWPDEKRPADWDLWAFIPHCEYWKAVALSLDLEPPEHQNSVKGWPPEFERRCKIAEAHIQAKILKWSKAKNGYFSVDLSAFSEWAQSLGWSLPDRFPHGVEAQTAPAAQVETDNAETLSALFDPVPVEALEKMFPAGGQWRGWADKASSNGLAAARPERAKFNPYKAAVWFVNRGAEGWDLSRCYRVLANNLPARSRDEKHLLTGGME